MSCGTALTSYQSQEAKYNEKVDAVKAQHDQLLQEAFERAKVSGVTNTSPA